MSVGTSGGTSVVNRLVKLSALTIIHQDGSFFERCDLSTLPRTVLQELLVASVSLSRILVFRSLIVNWPLEQVVLQKVSGFDEPKAVLLAYCLQRTQNSVKLIDIRGCSIGEFDENRSILLKYSLYLCSIKLTWLIITSICQMSHTSQLLFNRKAQYCTVSKSIP